MENPTGYIINMAGITLGCGGGGNMRVSIRISGAQRGNLCMCLGVRVLGRLI